MPKSTRTSKNLFLDSAAVARGERYSRLHDTSLSRLVGDFLQSLPLRNLDAALSPEVQRLRGAAAGSKTGKEKYRAYLGRKYGAR